MRQGSLVMIDAYTTTYRSVNNLSNVSFLGHDIRHSIKESLHLDCILTLKTHSLQN
jgi:hypothetical protein